MTDQEWYILFDETKDTFRWFFILYGYSLIWDLLLMMRRLEERKKMITVMNQIWFELPDGRFNIMENPEGWQEFLNLIEE